MTTINTFRQMKLFLLIPYYTSPILLKHNGFKIQKIAKLF